MVLVVSVLVAVAAVVGSTTAQPRLHEGDATAMVQQLLSVEHPKSPQPRAFSVGDHVFVQLDPIGLSASSVVKGSIQAVGSVKNTYDVHLWLGPPHKRELRGVPAQLLTDASAAEAEEAAQQKAEEAVRIKAEAKKRRKLEEEQRRREEQQRSLADLQRRAEEEDRRKAEEEARLRKEAEERREQEAAVAKVQQLIKEEETRKKAAENQVDRKAALKAKWESIKVARLKRAGAEHAPPEVQKMVLRGDNYRAQTSQKAAVPHQRTESATEDDSATHVHFRVMDLAHKTDAPFYVARATPLKAMMAKACERLGIVPEHGLFYSGRRKVHPDDTADTLGLKNGDVLTVMVRKKRVKF